MNRWIRAPWQWLDFRLGLGKSVPPMLYHPVPRGTGWWYVFGSATMAFFVLQVITGILLALVYVPSTEGAYQSLQYLNYQYPLGWLLRAVHNCGATAMVALLLLHMLRVFFWGAFKYPRELTWLVGVGLFAATIGMAFTGQVLRWDSDAYWALGVGTGITSRIPVLGEPLVRLMLGGPAIGPATLSRFFALHVFVLVGLLGGLLALHLYLVLKLGISTPPGRDLSVDPKTYEEEYKKDLANGIPFFPDEVIQDGIVAGALIVALVILAAIVGPRGPNMPADPTILHVYPRPDWYFLPLFALYALAPDYLQTFVLLGLPLLIGAILLAIPFAFGTGQRSFHRRPVALLTVLVLALSAGVLEYLAFRAPWSPEMDAWSGEPTPQTIVVRCSPEELQGAVVFQYKQCRDCHALEGTGGHRGPDLTYVGTRLAHDELIRQVIQGGGNMPPFGDRLRPAEVDALVNFLGSLRPRGVPPATTPASREEKRQGKWAQ